MGDGGILQFTLGLAAGSFVSGLDKANARLKTFIGGMVSVGAMAAGVWKQIEKGAALEKLSAQTGETVGNLAKLERGLKYAGVSGESAGNMIWMLQRALGGVNESGEPTAFVFAQLGLQIQQLKKMDAPAALQAIAGKLKGLNSSSAAAAAGRIFGRGSAREFAQLARNSDEFARGLKSGAVQAALFDKYAGTFEALVKGMERLKGKANDIFLGIATGIAPALENVIESLNSIDLSGIGKDIGTLLTAATQAFREGRLAELIGDSLKVGFEAILDFAPAIFEKVGYLLLKAFEEPLIYIQAGLEYALMWPAKKLATSKAFQWIVNAISPGKGTQVAGFWGGVDTSWEGILKDRREQGVKFNVGSGEFGLGDINKDANDRMQAGMAKFRDKWSGFWGEVTGFASRAPKPKPGVKNEGEKQDLTAAYRPERTAIEKMGFVFGGSAVTDHAASTARNTGMMARSLQRIEGAIVKGGKSVGGDFANA